MISPEQQLDEQADGQVLREMLEQRDPWAEQMQAEFEQIEQDLQNEGIDGDDKLLIWGYTRSLARREDEIERAASYYERTVTRLRREIESIRSWKGHLVEEAVARGIRGQKKKSLDTPGGRVGFKTRPNASLVFHPEDKDKLLDWAKEACPEAVTETRPVVISLAKTPIVEFIVEGGKCPFATIREPGEDFYYKPAKEKSARQSPG